MFDIGFAELLIIGVVALLVIGPERLPEAVRTASAWINRIRRGFNDIKQEVKQELHNDEVMRELRETTDGLRRETDALRDDLRQPLDNLRQPLGQLGDSANSGPAAPGPAAPGPAADAGKAAGEKPDTAPEPGPEPEPDHKDPSRND